MCMAKRFEEWKIIYPHRNKKRLLHLGLSLTKVQVCKIVHMDYPQQKKVSFLHDNMTVWLKPVSSDGQCIQLNKGKYPKSCVLDTSAPRDA